MNFSFKTIIFFICSISFFSCAEKKTVTPRVELKIAKTVPSVFINALDSSFSKHQDTIYYQGKFFTGYRYALYPNNDTAVIFSYFNGVEEGTQKKWYNNHQPSEERFYINGKKEGIQQAWWPDGKQKFYFEASNDAYCGVFKEWYSSGQMSKDFNYVNGQEEGSEKMWWANGAIRANYVIRNGKKYGLSGLVICKNPFDSINPIENDTTSYK